MRTKLLTLALLTTIGCATAAPRIEVEAPRELVETADHVARQPVHAGTNLATAFQAMDSDETPASIEGGNQEEAGPEVVAKGGGIKVSSETKGAE